MTPLKNGVVVFCEEHDCYFRADVYHLKGYGWLFRVNNQRFFQTSQETDFHISKIDAWFDAGAAHGTMLASYAFCKGQRR